jgi:uncharacterized protein
MTTATLWKLRAILVVGLALAPVVFLAGAGSYHLWLTGWSFITYWPMALCWLAAYGLGWCFTRKLKRRRPTDDSPVPMYWTERDRSAWAIVEAKVTEMPPLATNQVTDLNRYAEQAQNLSTAIAEVYQPGAADPFAHLTIPEILACGELIAHDLNKLVREGIPGSHMLTIGDIKRLRTLVDQATTWYPRLRNVYWLGSMIMNPLTTLTQIAYTKGVMAPAQSGVQSNIVQWFQTVYLREVGRYLIELNSGRLKVGAKRYLELTASATTPDVPTASEEPAIVTPVTVGIVGPVKAGKSSLVNAILGEECAATDVAPLTAGLTRYTLDKPGMPKLTLIDSAGFGLTGPTDDDVQVALAAAKEADILLLVVPARNAARALELDFMTRLHAAIQATPNLKHPPTLAVLSHVDLLTPAMEWAPPYDIDGGTRPKEVNIREALTAASETFGERVDGLVPVCTSPGKSWGVSEELLPKVLAQLGEARGVSLLRTLHAEADADKAKRVWKQLQTAGGMGAKLLKDWLKK